MKDPALMTDAELDALWLWGVTKAEMRQAHQAAQQLEQTARALKALADWRRANPEATCREEIARRLIEMAAWRRAAHPLNR